MKSNSFLAPFHAPIFIFSLFVTPIAAQLDTTRWRLFKDANFSVSFPKKGWVMLTDSLTGVPFYIATEKTSRKPYDRDVIQIRTMDNADNLYGTLEDYAADHELGGDVLVAEKKQRGELFYFEKITKNDDGKIKRKIKEHRYFINSKVYEAIFDAEKSVFDALLPQVDSILNALKIADFAASTVEKWLVHQTAQYSLTYPSNWIVPEILPQNVSFQLQKPQRSNDAGYRDNFYLIVNTYKASIPTLSDYAEKANAQLKTSLKNLSIISNGRKQGKNFTCSEVVSVGDLGKYRVKMRQWHFVKGKNAYTFTYTARAEKFDELASIIDAIFASLTLK